MDSYVFQTLKHVWRAYSSPERFFLVLASMLALASITGLAIVFVLAKTVTVPAQGGNYIEAVVGQPTGVNPVLANGDPEKFLVSLVFSPLGDIAKKIKPSSDLKEWDVRLKDNLYWQDGVPLTADDIIFTVSKIQDPMSRSPYASSWQGVTSERISSREIRFTLRAPYSFFNYTIDKLYPIPRHLFAGVPSGNWTLSEYNFRPVGNGHYRFLGYDTRNDGFITSYRLQQFSSRSSLAFIPDVTLRFYPSKKEALSALNSAEVDGLAGLDPADIDNLKRPLGIYAYTYSNYYAIFLNRSQNVALRDLSVRQALSLSIDRSSIVENVLRGYGIPSYEPITGRQFSSTSFLSEKEAGKILENSGWHLNGQGFREKKSKNQAVPLAFKLTVPNIPFLEETSRAIKTKWEKLGIKTELEILSVDRVIKETINNRSYEMLLFGNILEPPGDLFAFWNSSQSAAPGLNLSSYSNKMADRLISNSRRETDPAARQSDVEKASEIIARDYPAIFLFSPKYLFAVNKNIKGIEAFSISDPADRASAISEWYIQTKRVFR